MTSRWSLETTDQFDRDFKKLDRAVQRRVLTSATSKGSMTHDNEVRD